MRFEDLAIGQRFDWISDERSAFTRNSYFKRCVKTSARKYESVDGQDKCQVGSIKARVYHVGPTPRALIDHGKG